jgi:hypothetical protein
MAAKLDNDRNYYADLELPPTASIQEIRTQFRKLGRCPSSVVAISHYLGMTLWTNMCVRPYQLSSTIQIATLVAKRNVTRGSRPSTPHTRFSRMKP